MGIKQDSPRIERHWFIFETIGGERVCDYFSDASIPPVGAICDFSHLGIRKNYRVSSIVVKPSDFNEEPYSEAQTSAITKVFIKLAEE